MARQSRRFLIRSGRSLPPRRHPAVRRCRKPAVRDSTPAVQAVRCPPTTTWSEEPTCRGTASPSALSKLNPWYDQRPIEVAKQAAAKWLNEQPGRDWWSPNSATKVDTHRDDRTPLLPTTGGADHVVTPSLATANAQLYRSSWAVTAYHEFPGRSHFVDGEPGCEEEADYALDWAVEAANTLSPAVVSEAPCR